MGNFRNIFKAFSNVAFLAVLAFLELFSFINDARAQAPSNVALSSPNQWELQKYGEDYTFEPLFNDDLENTPEAPVISKIIVKGSYIYACADNKSVYRFGLDSNFQGSDNLKMVEEVYSGADSWIRAIATAPGLDEIATISQKGQMNFFRIADEADKQTFANMREIDVKTNSAHDLVYSPDGKYIAVCGSDPYITIYKINRDVDGNNLEVSLWKTLTVTNSVSTAIQFSSNGAMLAVGDRNGVVRVWRFDDGKLTGPFLKLTLNDENSNTGRRVRAVAFNDSSSLIAIGGDNSKILVYDVNTGELMSRLVPPNAEQDDHQQIKTGKGKIYSLVFCNDKLLVSGDSLNRVLLWNATAGIDQLNISERGSAEHTGTVSTLFCYSIDGETYILSSGFDAKIVRWKLVGRQNAKK